MRSLALSVWLIVLWAFVCKAELNATKQYDHPRDYLFKTSTTFTVPEGEYRLRVLLVGGGGHGCAGKDLGNKRGRAGLVKVIIIDKKEYQNKTFEVKVGQGGVFPTSHAQVEDNKRKESSFQTDKVEGGKDCSDASGFSTNMICLEHFQLSRITRDTVARDINISACHLSSQTPAVLRSGEGGILINGMGPSALPGKSNLSSPGGNGYGAGGGSGGNHKLPPDVCNSVDGGDGAPGVVYVEVVPRVCRRPVSVIFAIGYASNNSFTNQKKTISNIIQLMPQSKVGVITFKGKASLKIKLREYKNSELLSEISDLENKNSTEMVNFSNVYKTALRAFEGKKTSKMTTNSRVNFKRTIVMFTHSWRNDASGNMILQSLKKRLKSLGIKIVLVGLDENLSETQLQEKVNEDDHVHTSRGDDYQWELPMKEPYIIDAICREPPYHHNSSAIPTKAISTSISTPIVQGKTADELQKDYEFLLNYNMNNIHIKNTTEIQRIINIADELIQNSHRIPNTTKIAPGLKVIKFMEDVGLKIASTMQDNNENIGSSPRHFNTSNLGISVSVVNLMSTQSIHLPDPLSEGLMTVPKDAFEGSGRGTVVMLTSSAVASMKKENNSKIITQLVSINVNPKSPKVFKKPVELVFGLNKVALEGEQVSCEFWDHKKRENLPHGSWSAEGCKVASENDTTVTCYCNHLTSFAVLTGVHPDAKPYKDHAKYLTIITYVGCSLSMLGCLLTILVHAVLPSLRTERAFIHINLVTAIFFGQGFFFVAALLQGPRAVCFVTAVALYFFYLSVFAWMLVEGLHIYCLVIRVFHSGHERKRLYMAIGWLVPLFITVICASAFRGEFVSTKLCWLSLQSGAIWAFVGPAIIIIAVNLVILILVLRVTAGVMVKDEIQNRSNRSLVRACITLLPILGLTWMFGILAFSNRTVVFEYLFCIFNSLQGLFIFLFYCVGSSEVRRECRRKLHNYETKRSLRTSNTSGYNKSGKPTNSSKISRNSETVKDKDQTSYENTLL